MQLTAAAVTPPAEHAARRPAGAADAAAADADVDAFSILTKHNLRITMYYGGSAMNRPITVRLPDDLQEILQDISKKEHVPVSDVVRESIRRYISIYQFRQLRRKTLPFAEAQGLLVDEDVFRELK